MLSFSSGDHFRWGHTVQLLLDRSEWWGAQLTEYNRQRPSLRWDSITLYVRAMLQGSPSLVQQKLVAGLWFTAEAKRYHHLKLNERRGTTKNGVAYILWMSPHREFILYSIFHYRWTMLWGHAAGEVYEKATGQFAAGSHCTWRSMLCALLHLFSQLAAWPTLSYNISNPHTWALEIF